MYRIPCPSVCVVNDFTMTFSLCELWLCCLPSHVKLRLATIKRSMCIYTHCVQMCYNIALILLEYFAWVQVRVCMCVECCSNGALCVVHLLFRVRHWSTGVTSNLTMSASTSTLCLSSIAACYCSFSLWNCQPSQPTKHCSELIARCCRVPQYRLVACKVFFRWYFSEWYYLVNTYVLVEALVCLFDEYPAFSSARCVYKQN